MRFSSTLARFRGDFAAEGFEKWPFGQYRLLCWWPSHVIESSWAHPRNSNTCKFESRTILISFCRPCTCQLVPVPCIRHKRNVEYGAWPFCQQICWWLPMSLHGFLLAWDADRDVVRCLGQFLLDNLNRCTQSTQYIRRLCLLSFWNEPSAYQYRLIF